MFCNIFGNIFGKSIFFENISGKNIFFSSVGLHPAVPRADSVTLYLESASAEDVEVQRWQEDQSWRLEAEANIEALRKRELRINFRGVDARTLTVEVL